MIVAICGQCGWLGGPDTLELIDSVDDDVLEKLSEAMKSNDDASYLACPSCQSRDVFYKHLQGGVVPKPIFLEVTSSISLGGAGFQIVDPEEPEIIPDVVIETAPIVVEQPASVVAPAPAPGMPEMMQMFATMLQTMQNGGQKPEEPAPRALQDNERIPAPEVDARGRPVKPGTQPVTDTDRAPFPFVGTCDECDNSFKSKVEGSTRCDRCTKKLVK